MRGVGHGMPYASPRTGSVPTRHKQKLLLSWCSSPLRCPLGYDIWCALCCICSLMVVSVDAEYCRDVQNRCFMREGCQLALQNYWQHCTMVTNGAVYHCTPECTQALVMLLTSEEQGGEDFISCDCEGEEFCVEQKRRINICQPQVQQLLDEVNGEDSSISCNLASLLCYADTECLTALHFYDSHCRRMFYGEACTSRCKNSINILYRQRKAKKLQNCYCDGDDHSRHLCLQERNHMETLCFQHRRRHPNSRRHHSSSTQSPTASVEPPWDSQDKDKPREGSDCTGSNPSVVIKSEHNSTPPVHHWNLLSVTSLAMLHMVLLRHLHTVYSPAVS